MRSSWPMVGFLALGPKKGSIAAGRAGWANRRSLTSGVEIEAEGALDWPLVCVAAGFGAGATGRVIGAAEADLAVFVLVTLATWTTGGRAVGACCVPAEAAVFGF